jgi:hypothetical protein
MFEKQFLRKSSCLLLALGLISITGGNVQGAKEEKEKDAKEKTYALNEAQLQSHVMSFADRFVSILITALQNYDTRKPSKKDRYEVRELITYSLSNGYIIAGESDPDIALLDMLSMVTLGRIIFEKEGLSKYGKAVEPIIEGFRVAERDIRKIAAIVLTPDELTNLMTIINRWRKQNPEVIFYPLIRFSNFAGERRESTLTRAEEAEGLFESVESASETVEEMRLLAERGMYLATRMPQLWGMFGDLWLTNILNGPDIKKILTDLSGLSQGTSGLAAIAEKLPDQIATERETTIKQVMSAVSTERKAAIKDITTEREATIKQMMSAISVERKAAMADFLAEFKRIEERLIPEIAKAMDRAESEGEELVDHTMRQAIVLIGIWLIGYVIARLLIQYFSNKMKPSAK